MCVCVICVGDIDIAALCAHIHIHLHAHITEIHTCTSHTYIRTHKHIYMYTNTYVHINTYTCTQTYTPYPYRHESAHTTDLCFLRVLPLPLLPLLLALHHFHYPIRHLLHHWCGLQGQGPPRGLLGLQQHSGSAQSVLAVREREREEEGREGGRKGERTGTSERGDGREGETRRGKEGEGDEEWEREDRGGDEGALVYLGECILRHLSALHQGRVLLPTNPQLHDSVYIHDLIPVSLMGSFESLFA